MLGRRSLIHGLGGLASTGAVGCLGSGRRPTVATVAPPLLRVLGTAQDGGLPHAACSCPHCLRAQRSAAHARYVASVAVVGANRRVALIDATPDLRRQLPLLGDVRPRGAAARYTVDRHPLDAIFVSHAHLGHYTGLAQLGFEAVSAEAVPTHVTPKMAEFLRSNAPWQQLVDHDNLVLVPSEPGTAVSFAGLQITPVSVPHRDEYADTVGYRIEGPRRTVLYIPDCKPWSQWAEPPERLFVGVDDALLDGTFFSLDELPGRDVTQTGHPLVRSTMQRFADWVADGGRVHFTHLNHSNPVVDRASAAHREVRARGFFVLEDGVDLSL